MTDDQRRLVNTGAIVKVVVLGAGGAAVETTAVISTFAISSGIDTKLAESLGVEIHRAGVERKRRDDGKIDRTWYPSDGCYADLIVPSVQDHRIARLPMMLGDTPRDEFMVVLGREALVGLLFTYDGRSGTFTLAK